MSTLVNLIKFANYVDAKGDFQLADLIDAKIAKLANDKLHPQMAPFPSYKPLEIGEAKPMLSSEHNALSLLGLMPILGEGFDLTNAIAYAEKRQYVYSGLSLLSMIPVVGDAIGKGVPLISKLLELIGKGVKPQVILAGFSQADQMALEKAKELYTANKNIIDKLFVELEMRGPLRGHAKNIKGALDSVFSIL